VATASAFGFAGLAVLGIVLKLLVEKEKLLACCENKIRSAVHAGEYSVRVFHSALLLAGIAHGPLKAIDTEIARRVTCVALFLTAGVTFPHVANKQTDASPGLRGDSPPEFQLCDENLNSGRIRCHHPNG
jgi:hypothetical protein